MCFPEFIHLSSLDMIIWIVRNGGGGEGSGK